MINILIVEDNPGDARLVREVLSEENVLGFSFKHVPTLKEALEWLGTNLCDIVLLDLSLPDSDGLGGLEKIVSKKSNIPIVILTGQKDKQIGLEALKKGAQDFIFKGTTDGALLGRVILYAIERKQTEEKLREAMQAKSEFTSMVSHELRTPLTVIKESIGIIQDGTTGAINPEQEEFLAIAKRNIDRLARLINEVLDFQKLESK